MTVRPIKALIATFFIVALGLIALQDWSLLNEIAGRDLSGLAFLLVLALFSDTIAFTLTVSKSTSSSLAFVPLLTALVLFGPLGALGFMIIAGGIGELVIRRKAPMKVAFNWAQFVISLWIAGHAFRALGGEAQALETGPFNVQVFPLMAAAAIVIAFNQIAVALAIAVSERRPVGAVIGKMIAPSNANLLYGWLISPLAIGLAFLYSRLWLPGLLLAFLPIVFIRHAYLTNHQLQHTNRALLKALVKAIETRDPYTSGHSLRVSALSRRIALALRLTTKKVERIETAALLHDIGKIEAIYTEILQKPGDLSEEEREIIESHVTKGVELLTSLGSFPREIIDSVRYHHEREDGKGYPDGISGQRIPLGARIIKVVDAIDAMLSDRPYRKALSIETVKEQLDIYRGTQFNAAIVDVVMNSTLLEEHAAELASARAGAVNRLTQLDDWQDSAEKVTQAGDFIQAVALDETPKALNPKP